jgi:two-component system CheB/CheR fusion protein
MGAVSLDRDVAVHLYRIAREALANARQHADANHVDVALQAEDGQVVLTVRDDGVGPPMDGRLEEVSKGLGVRLMRYRADLLGASLHVRPAEGSGTVVRCEVPTATDTGEEADG